MFIIGITTYNRKDLLESMAKSLKECEFSIEYQIRVYDDASTEISVEDIKKIFPDAEVYRNEKNVGSDANLWCMYKDFVNRGSKGDFLFNCDSDLIFNHNFVEKSIDMIKNTDGVLSLFNTPNHKIVCEQREFVIKETVGSAGTVFTYDIAKMIIEKFNTVVIGGLDMKWSKYLRESGIRLFCTKKSLIQHIGMTGFNSDLAGFDYGTGFEVDSHTNGQIINDTVERLAINYKDAIKRKWYVVFPYYLIPKGSRVIIYGASEIGYDYYKQLTLSDYYKFVGIVDKTKIGIKFDNNVRVQDPRKIIDMDFDLILIGALLEKTINSIKKDIASINSSYLDKVVYSDNRVRI